MAAASPLVWKSASGLTMTIRPRPAALGRPFSTAGSRIPRASAVVNFDAASPSATQRPSVSSPVSTIQHSSRSFHSSRPHSDAPRSPFAVFVETLKAELKKSQELQDNMKQLQGEAGKVQDSETMKRMREAYERARIITSIKENPRLQKAAEQLRKSGGQVGDAVGATLKQMEDSELIKGLGAISSRLARQLADSTAPVRNSEAYKAFSETLLEAFDDGGSALRIDTSHLKDAREARRLKREARLRKIGRPPPSKDPEAPEQAAETVMDEAAEAHAPEADPVRAAAEAGAAAGSAGARAAAAEDAAGQASADGSAGSQQDQATASTSAAPKPAPKKKPAGFAVRVRSMQEDPNAGQALVLSAESSTTQAWNRFKSENPFMRRLSSMREAYDESENPVVERLRGITETIGGWFEENEFAQVVGAFRIMEPTFTLDSFQRDLREYLIPEIIDAYHGAARHLLRQWCSEATYNVLMATIDPYVSKGMLANGRLMDLRGVDILQAKMLENNVPVLVVTFQTSELMYFKDSKTGAVKVGSESQAESCRYAMVLRREENELDNEVTGGWKVAELARRGQGAFL